MSALRVVLGRAAAATLLVWAVQALAGWLTARRMTDAVSGTLPTGFSPGVTDAARVLEASRTLGWNDAASAAGVLAIHFLLSPLLALLWMRSMRTPGRLGHHLAFAARRYPTALLFGVAAALTWLLAGGLLAATAMGLELATPHLSTGVLLSLLAGALALATGTAFVVSTLGDLALAALAGDASGVKGSLHAATRSLRPRLLAHRLLAAALGLTCFVAGDLLARATATGAASSVLPLLVVEAAALAAVVARGHFLHAASTAVGLGQETSSTASQR